MQKSYALSASLICGNPLELRADLKALETAGVEYLHFDVMDGAFVPRLGLYPELLRSIKDATSIPVDVHLMINQPEKYASLFIEAGADIVTIHAEAVEDLKQVVGMIKSLGRKAGVALRPGTSLSVLDIVRSEVDLVLLMAIHPGILGQKLIPETLQKVREAREKFKDRPGVIIEVDGGVTPESAPEMIRMGANMLVCGTGTIYRPQEDTLENKVNELRKTIGATLYES